MQNIFPCTRRGSEPHHAYGNGNNLFHAYKIFLHHWKMLYLVSKMNHKQGIKHWGFMKGMKHLLAAKKHFDMLKKADRKHPVS